MSFRSIQLKPSAASSWAQAPQAPRTPILGARKGASMLLLMLGWTWVLSAHASPEAPRKAEAASQRSVVQPAGLNSPGAVVTSFAAHFNAAQLDALMGLYENGAVFVPAPGQAVTTMEGIRAATAQFLSLRLPIHIQVRHVFEAGDVALVVSDWTIRGKAPSGDAIDLAGTATDVMRRSASGGWRYVIDNPFGGQRPQP